MPLYDYTCDNRHVTEERQGLDIISIPCPICGRCAARSGVYRGQYIQCETGPVGGKKNPIDPKDEDLSKPFAEFQEASGEVAHEYAKEEARTGRAVTRPNLFKEALAVAHRKDQRIKKGNSGEARIGSRLPHERPGGAHKAV
jgi:hypothetical protein